MSLPPHAGGHFAFDLDQHVFGFFGQQGLRGHDVLDLAGANAVRQRAKRAVGGGVRVAANNGHARQGGAFSGPMTWTMPWRLDRNGK